MLESSSGSFPSSRQGSCRFEIRISKTHPSQEFHRQHDPLYHTYAPPLQPHSQPPLTHVSATLKALPTMPTFSTTSSIPPFQTTFAVPLHCEACITSVTNALQSVPGISPPSPLSSFPSPLLPISSLNTLQRNSRPDPLPPRPNHNHNRHSPALPPPLRNSIHRPRRHPPGQRVCQQRRGLHPRDPPLLFSSIYNLRLRLGADFARPRSSAPGASLPDAYAD